ncbi:MAG: ABC transporter permease subunit [Acidimicrobiia bacterium]
MTWLTWRQFRLQAATGTVAAAAIAIVAAVTGPKLADLAASNSSVFDALTKTDRTLFFSGIIILAVAPALIGAFWGAPIVARELETGTYRLAWGQSVTRTRWLASKLAITTLAAALAVGVMSLAVTWWSSAIDGAVSTTRGSLPDRITPVTFAMRGIAPIGYTVFAIALGALVGAVLRRTVPAMAVTMAIYIAVQIAMPLMVRPHLLAPVTTTVAFDRETLEGITLRNDDSIFVTLHLPDRGNWVLVNETLGPGGEPAPLPQWFEDCLPPPDGGLPGVARANAVGKDTCLTELTDAGYRQRVVYQPASRFWPLQWVETGVYLAMSSILAALCLWWVRRRLT